MSPPINGAESNPSALLLSELAELARSHHRQTRSTYHGTTGATGSAGSSLAGTPAHSPASTQSDGRSPPGHDHTRLDHTRLAPIHGDHPTPQSTAAHTPASALTPVSLHSNHHSPYATQYSPHSSPNAPSMASAASTGLSSADVSPGGLPIKQDLASDAVLGQEGAGSTGIGKNGSAGTASPPSGAQLVGQTDVDKMMLLVQQKSRENAAHESSQQYSFECETCGKRFRQRAHLHTHVRSHTGERPFVCPFQGCHKNFSQRCNLRTHIRSHTGERPYVCEHCGRGFSQQGNMRHHQLTHFNDHPLVCKLDDCKKQFNQLGNLKAHQNSAHREIVHAFTERLQSGATREDLPPEDRDMFDYFCGLYKNSNRGIRGRGKGTKTICDKILPRARRGTSPPSLYESQAKRHKEQEDELQTMLRPTDREQDGLPHPSRLLPMMPPTPDLMYQSYPGVIPSSYPAPGVSGPGVSGPGLAPGVLPSGILHPGVILPAIAPASQSTGQSTPAGSNQQTPQAHLSRAPSQSAQPPSPQHSQSQPIASAASQPSSLTGAFNLGGLPPPLQTAPRQMSPFTSMPELRDDLPKGSSSLIPPINAPPLQGNAGDQHQDPSARQYIPGFFASMPAPV